MDPITILSLVANLAQFAELAVKLVSEARSVYNSATRTPHSVEALYKSVEALDNLAARVITPGANCPGSGDEAALAELSDNAKKLAVKIKIFAVQLKTKHPRSKFDAIRVTVKAKIMKSELEKLEQNVAAVRSDIIESDKQSSTLNLLKRDLEQLREANDTVLHMVADVNRIMSDTAQSMRRQMQHDSAALIVIRERAEQIMGATMKTRSLDKIMEKLKFQQFQAREISIEDASQQTFRWLIQDEICQSSAISITTKAGSDLILDSNSSLASQSTNSLPDQALLISMQSNDRQYLRLEYQRYQLSVQEKQRARTRECFMRWLRLEHGIFYISGKFGSGKSTLMKYLCLEDKIVRELQIWAADKVLVFVKFFFWAAGAKSQRSLSGLYRSILWQILRVCPESVTEIFPERLSSPTSKSAGTVDDTDYTIIELQAAFNRLMKSTQIFSRYKICIFIDGLDEYEGNHWDIAKSFVQWSQHKDIKMCISCRPENDFEHHFWQEGKTALRLQELTRLDMLNLVDDRLFGDERFVAIQDQEGLRNFREEIVERAEGVFLWLTLAIDDLLDGLGNSYSLPQLRQKLATIPPEVGNIYKSLLDSLSPSDRKLASQTLLTLLELQKPLWEYEAGSDMIFSFLDDIADKGLKEPAHSIEIEHDALTDNEMTIRCKTIQMRINKRCKGLIQSSPGGWFRVSKVFQPAHRTMLDHLNQPDTLTWLKQGTADFDPHISLLLSHIQLAQVLKHGATYYQPAEFKAVDSEKALVDSYRLSRCLHGVSNQICVSLASLSDHNLVLKLVDTFSEVFESHYSDLQKIRNSDWLVSASPSIWKRRLFDGLFSGHEDLWITSFTSYIFQMIRGPDHLEFLDAMLSQTKFGSTLATRKLLLGASSSTSQTMAWNEPMADGALFTLKSLLRHKIDANAVLPHESICVHTSRYPHKGYGDNWTSWTASLFSAVGHVDSRRPNKYLVEIVTSYLSCGADANVVLVGYLLGEAGVKDTGIQEPHLFSFEDPPPFSAECQHLGPYYIDICQLLTLWKTAGVKGVDVTIAQVQKQLAVSWGAEIRNSLMFWKGRAECRVKRLDTDELKSKILMVLNVIPMHRLSEIVVEDLEQTWQSLKSGETQFVNMR